MRIAIAGISSENSNFSLLPTRLVDFTISADGQLLDSGRYPFLSELDAEFVPTLFAGSLPGGEIEAAAYLTLKDGIVGRLAAAGALDGVYLDLHGAMKVQGMDDAEADLAAAVRAVIGPKALIAASMDLHGNISQGYVTRIDMLTAYRTAPHRDMLETRRKACQMLVRCLQTGARPHVACVPIPVLLPGEATRTDMQPGSRLWPALADVDRAPDVLDASLFVGFAWVDEPRAHAAAVVTGTDDYVIQREARAIAQAYWDARLEFNYGVRSGPIDEGIRWALAAAEPCVFMSDSGDNVTAGAAGDIPLFLERLLAHQAPSALVAGIADAAAVQTCAQAGEGAVVRLELGGKLDPVHGRPLPVSARVHRVVHDAAVGAQAVVQVENVLVIITERRSAFTSEADFQRVGVKPLAHKIVVVKLGYLFPDLLRIAPAAYMALSPGVSDLDLARLPYKRIARPMFPVDAHGAFGP